MPIAAPAPMIDTSRLSALRNASGMKPTASTASVMSRSGEAIFGSTTVAARGRKISAAPKPEKPRAIAAMNADDQQEDEAASGEFGGQEIGHATSGRARRNFGFRAALD